MRGQWRYDKRTVEKPEDLPAAMTRLEAEGWEIVDRVPHADGQVILIVKRAVVREIKKTTGELPDVSDVLDIARKAVRR